MPILRRTPRVAHSVDASRSFLPLSRIFVSSKMWPSKCMSWMLYIRLDIPFRVSKNLLFVFEQAKRNQFPWICRSRAGCHARNGLRICGGNSRDDFPRRSTQCNCKFLIRLRSQKWNWIENDSLCLFDDEIGNEHGGSCSTHRCRWNSDDFTEYYQVPVEWASSTVLSTGHFVPGPKGMTARANKYCKIKSEIVFIQILID